MTRRPGPPGCRAPRYGRPYPPPRRPAVHNRPDPGDRAAEKLGI